MVAVLKANDLFDGLRDVFRVLRSAVPAAERSLT
jgi:hypothetical protein